MAFHGYPEMFLNSEFSNWLNNYLNELKIDISLKNHFYLCGGYHT